MASRALRNTATALFVVAIAFIGTTAIVSFLSTRDFPVLLLAFLLWGGVGFYIYERIFPLGARTLHKTRLKLTIPGDFRIQIQPSAQFTIGRVVVIFDRPAMLFNGTVRVASENRQLAIISLPVIEQFNIKAVGSYNRDLIRGSDRVYLNLKAQGRESSVLNLELRLWHNVTNSKLKEELNVKDIVEVDILLKGR